MQDITTAIESLRLKVEQTDTDRSLIIFPAGATDEDMEKSVSESRHLLWLFTRREHPLARWNEPTIHFRRDLGVVKGETAITEALAALSMCKATIQAWNDNSGPWQKTTRYRQVMDEELAVGDRIWGKYGGVFIIDRLTAKRAFAGAVNWPRHITPSRFHAAGRSNNHHSDTVLRPL